jgi:capsular exopolysaccharide synthesis family protein
LLSTDQILTVLWRRRLTVLITFLLTLGAVAAVTFSLPKVYTTSAYMLVTPSKQAGDDFAATQVSQVLTKTYGELLQTRGVADLVARELPFATTGEELLGSVTVAPIPDSQLLQISADASSPEEAQSVANTYAEVFSERARATQETTGSRATIAEAASRPTSPSKPRPNLYLLIGSLVALFTAVSVALLRHRFDQRLEIETSTRELFDLPVIARIPQRSGSVLEGFVRGERARDGAAAGLDEAFRLLLANLSFVSAGQRPRTLAVVSGGEREGKTTCSASIGRAGMEMGLDVLLVDADLRRANLSRGLDVAPEALRSGLSSILVTSGRLEDATVRVPNQFMEVVPAGPLPPNPTALLSLPAFAEFDRQAREAYDLVVYDTPPLAVGADASLVAARVEGVILVVDARSTKRGNALNAVDQLRRAGANVLGVVINRSRDAVDYYYAREPDEAELILNGNGTPSPAAAARAAGLAAPPTPER